MHCTSCIIVLCAVGASIEASDTYKLPPQPTSLPPFVPTNTTTSATTTTTTTVKPTNSTTTTTTTTTVKPTTTTTTTTVKPTTTTTTTTVKPTTTPTTVPPPTPKPNNEPAVNDFIGNYSGKNAICFMAKMAIQVEVLATNTTLNITKAVTSNVLCPSPNYESLTIYWDNNNTVNFGFAKNESKYEIESINVTVLLPGAKATTTYSHKKPEFRVSDKLSYFCSKDQALSLTDGQSNVTLAKIHLSHLQYQAFMNTTEAKYASVWNCDGVNTSDVVPVVVGSVLAVLVVLVLAVYLFGRRRCQARGYLSM